METLYPYPRTNESNSFSSINEEMSFNDFVWHEVLKDVRQINEESPESAVQINLDLSEEVVESHLDGSETDKLAGEDPIRENAAEINLNYLCNHEGNALQEEGVNISDLCIQKEKAISNLYSQEEEEDGSCDKNESLLEVINNQNDKPWSQWGECGTEDVLLGTVFTLPDHLSNATGSVEMGNYDEESGSRLKTLKADKMNGGYCKENIVVNEAEGILKKKPKNRGEKESSSRKNDVRKDGSLPEGKRNSNKTKKGSLRVSEELFSQREDRSSSKELGDAEGEAKEFECDTCRRSFNRQADLKVHQRLHTGKHQFKCSWCGKEFLRSSFLKNHVAIHEGGATAYKCKFCPKEFSHRSYLKKHEWLHMGLKPFKCDGCEKEFSSRANLEVHRRVHTGERPFKCTFCDKSFAQSYAKKIHERLHTGEKPLQCPLCQKTFNCGGNLKNHEKGHVKEMMRKSKLCVRVLTLDGIVEAFHDTIQRHG